VEGWVLTHPFIIYILSLVQYGDFWGLIMAIRHPDAPVDSLEWVIERTSEGTSRGSSIACNDG
jgi:hypothetical protein